MSSHMSESIGTPATAAALSFADPDVTRPVNLLQDSASRAPQEQGHSLLARALVVCLGLYCTPAVTLFQQHYKGVRRAAGGAACAELWAAVAEGLRAAAGERADPRTTPSELAGGEGAVAANGTAARGGREGGVEPLGTGDWASALDGFWGVRMARVSRETAGPDGVFFDEALQRRDCAWYLVEARSAPRASFAWGEGEREHCGKADVQDRAICEARPGCMFFERAAPAGERGSGCYLRDCDARSGAGARCYRRAIHTYDKGFSLFVESICAMIVHWTWAYLQGGPAMLRSCFDISKMRKFAFIGCLFGFSSVFAFLAQAKLTPGSYLIIGQASIIIVPIMWRLTFRSPIPMLSWMHIVTATLGIYMYFLADLEPGGGSDSLAGVFYAFTKVVMAAIAAVNTDKYLKTLNDIPFTVQVSYILPFKTCACLAVTFILPPHGFPPAKYRPWGAFHDMNSIVLIILIHSLGSTIATACVVKVFDSVAKALIGVISIIFPTWVVSYAFGWDTIEWSTDQGKLKVFGGTVVILMALAYVLGRSQASALNDKADQLAEIEEQRVQQRSELGQGEEQRQRIGDAIGCKIVWEPGGARGSTVALELQPRPS